LRKHISCMPSENVFVCPFILATGSVAMFARRHVLAGIAPAAES
jgi:hypothetical protein